MKEFKDFVKKEDPWLYWRYWGGIALCAIGFGIAIWNQKWLIAVVWIVAFIFNQHKYSAAKVALMDKWLGDD